MLAKYSEYWTQTLLQRGHVDALVVCFYMNEIRKAFSHFFSPLLFRFWHVLDSPVYSLFIVDCFRNDWTSRNGHCAGYTKANPGDGCHETGATWKILAAWASSCSNLFWSPWGKDASSNYKQFLFSLFCFPSLYFFFYICYIGLSSKLLLSYCIKMMVALYFT